MGGLMSVVKIFDVVSFAQKFWTPEYQELFPFELVKLLIHMHQKFNNKRVQLIQERVARQKCFDEGGVPDFLDKESEAVKGNWKVSSIPSELLCRRVEITGPVNSAKIVINMLNRTEVGDRADMAMLDFEDSMKPSFQNVLDGYKNVIGAVTGNLTFFHDEKKYQLNSRDKAYVMVRTRGLHLNESNFKIHGEEMSGGLLDLVVCFFHTASIYKAQKLTPKYYIPKCEHYLEARWWNEVFSELEKKMGMEVPTLRATFLIETLPAAYQAEEILYEIKEHAAGLNVGRWDKIFSDIKVLKNHPDRIMADRGSINMQRSWMENYAKRIIKICHDRGAFAMGGMAAFTPGKSSELREQQMRKVQSDKKLEADWGHDGCWVSHPYFIQIAMNQMKFTNQLKRIVDYDKYADILPKNEGPHTIDGLRTNIRVGIAYMDSWERDIGCVAFDDLMEDLATLEISRVQTWQWLHHNLVLDDGTHVTRGLVTKIFDEEYQKIVKEIKNELPEKFHRGRELELGRARETALRLFTQYELSEFLTTASSTV